MSALTKLFGRARKILFPPACLACGRNLFAFDDKHPFLCSPCEGEIQILPTLFDGISKKRLPDNRRFEYPKDSYLLGAAASYSQSIVKDLIWKMKYRRQKATAQTLAMVLAKYLRSLDLDLSDFFLVPLPIYYKRKRARGFNQAELITRHLSHILQMPMIIGALKRVKGAESQTQRKNIFDRKRYLRNAFMVSAPAYIRGKRIILLDDVFTTGSTMNEAVKTIREAGASEVMGLVVAKA
ncbi:MAG: phosphoribosyltransferase family protein [bacterium]|nr:phosphoribosyltransferase family protein [bacterium]